MVAYWEQLTTLAYRHCRSWNRFQRDVHAGRLGTRVNCSICPSTRWRRSVWKHLSRHFVVRHDYQAFEYTTYVYRHPVSATDGGAGRLVLTASMMPGYYHRTVRGIVCARPVDRANCGIAVGG